MLAGLRKLVEAGVGWVDAESTLLLSRSGRAAARVALLLASALCGALALCGLMAGVGLLLAPHVGAGPTVLLLSGLVLSASVLLAWRTARGLRTIRASARVEAEAVGARERLKDALPGSDEPEASGAAGSERGVEPSGVLGGIGGVLAKTLADPGLISGSVFAVVSVLGVGRTVRLARLAASALGSAAVIANALQPDSDIASNGVEPRHASGRSARAGSVGSDVRDPSSVKTRSPGRYGGRG